MYMNVILIKLLQDTVKRLLILYLHTSTLVEVEHKIKVIQLIYLQNCRTRGSRFRGYYWHERTLNTAEDGGFRPYVAEYDFLGPDRHAVA